MYDGCSRAWHYDGTDTVITILLQKPDQVSRLRGKLSIVFIDTGRRVRVCSLYPREGAGRGEFRGGGEAVRRLVREQDREGRGGGHTQPLQRDAVAAPRADG